MPPTLADRLVHILSAIQAIQSMLAGKTLENFVEDFPLRLGVERAFEIICEASHRIPDDVKAQHPEIDWRRMTDFGNLLRHAYHRIDPKIVFEIAARELPPLKTFAESGIRDEEK